MKRKRQDRKRKRGRPANRYPIYVTSLRHKYPDADALASILLDVYKHKYAGTKYVKSEPGACKDSDVSGQQNQS